MTTFDEEFTETITHTDTLRSSDWASLAETLSIIDPDTDGVRAYPYVVSETINITPTAAYALYITRLISEVVSLSDPAVPLFAWARVLTDSVSLADSIQLTDVLALLDTINLTPTAAYLSGVALVENFGISEAIVGSALRLVTVAELMTFAENFANFIDGTIIDALTLIGTVVRTKLVPGALTETVEFADVAARSLIIRVTAPETLEITHTQVLQAIYKPTIEDGFEIAAAFLNTDDSFTTWAVNTNTGAVTEYLDFNFNSFAMMGNRYIGISDTGVYELNGDDDAGDDIIAAVKSGWLQFAGAKFTSFKGIYLGMRAERGSEMYLKLTTGDDKSYTYLVTVKDMETTRVYMGKGLRARYFAFELITTGQDFDLDTIEFIPIAAERRV
jgi:hypothetical protein